uniref:PRELI/MSF1 domain-containing protein n=1 Tax=Salarias fasciatus TaxID=181472 RepID=A0A672GS77_SALFA
MVKYFCSSTDIRSAWDHVVSAFWQRYPNPFSTHVLTEDVVYRETNRLPRWGERFFPSGMARSVYIIEDSIGTPGNTLNHNSAEQPGTTLLKREAWISSGIYGFSKPIQVHTAATQFGLISTLHYYYYYYYYFSVQPSVAVYQVGNAASQSHENKPKQASFSSQ